MYQLRVANTITEDAWLGFLKNADVSISELCADAYHEQVTDFLRPWGAPTGAGNNIKTKQYFLSGGVGELVKGFVSNITSLASSFQGYNSPPPTQISALGLPNIFNVPGVIPMLEWSVGAGTFPPSWTSTKRPAERSSRLSRFSPEYNESSVNATLGRVSADIRDNARLLLQASAEFESHTCRRPLAMAVGTAEVILSLADGHKEDEPLICRWPIPAARNDPTANGHALDLGDTSAIVTGFFDAVHQILIESQAIWCAGDERIKAFDPETGDLMHTLSCGSSFDGAFAVDKNSGTIFRPNASGKFALWNRGQLTRHDPAYHGVSSSHTSHESLVTDCPLGLEKEGRVWGPNEQELAVTDGLWRPGYS